MAEAVIGPLVGRLHDLAVSEARTLVAVSKDIRRLRDKLMWLQAFLREADNRRRRSDSDELINVWLQQTRDAVFDAEDAVDHYFLQVDMSRYPTWTQAILRFLAGFTTQMRVRHILSSKIKDINLRLEDIIQNKDKYKLDEKAKHKTQSDTWKASTSISEAHKKLDELHPPFTVKRKDKQKDLEDKLCGGGESPFVISVVGVSGIGKTTLVRDVYKRVKAMKKFEVQAMHSFPPYLSSANIRQQIVQQLTDDDTNCQRKDVNTMLKEKLNKKKYLLVIDGEISSTEWTDIEEFLRPFGAKGSRVVRIRQEEPAEQLDTHHHDILKVDHLNEEDTKTVFLKRLPKTEAGKEEYRVYIEKRKADIHKITEGLPLAAVLLSGLVQTKEFSSEWTMVFDRLNLRESKRLHSILSLCFDDLPHELKSCFLYFAALPANMVIEERTLVCMWMAEGFLTPKLGKTMEKVGHRYLDELVIRNLVNVVHMDESPRGRILAVQNKVHDFLQFEAHESSFVEVHSGDDIPTLTSARRLSLQNYTDKYAALASPLPKLRSIFSQFEEEPKEEEQPKKVQTERNMCFSCQRRTKSKEYSDIKSHIRGLLRGSEYLRVINLQGIEIGEKLPDEIGNVVHLQYLGITSCSLKEIPESIGRLSSLQTLDVRETSVRKLPSVFWMIETLRHVFGFVLKLPKKAGKFKHLYTLDSIGPDEDYELGWSGTLAKMIHLEFLSVWYISNDNLGAFCNALSKLENLRTLILRRGIIPPRVFTSYSLRRLKYMVLQGKLPSELKGMASRFPNLIMLSLEETDVSQDLIKNLARLPSLVTLVLHSCKCKDEKLVFSSAGFRCLNKLKVDVEGLETLQVAKDALLELEELDIHVHPSGPKIDAEQRIRGIITVENIDAVDADRDIITVERILWG